MSSHEYVFRTILIISYWLVATLNGRTECLLGAGEAPVIVDDGRDNFLILNEDEVASNAQLLSFLSTASKEDVEEIVDSNPHVQEQILNKIKGAVEERQRKKEQKAKRVPSKIGASVQAEKGAQVQSHSSPLGLPRPNIQYDTHGNNGQGGSNDSDDDDDEDDDDEDPVTEQQVARWRAQIQSNALKVFRVGKRLRDRVVALTRRRDGTSTTTSVEKEKDKSKKKKKKQSWPHFHYKISSN